MAAYYNEIDPYAAQWLRNLMREELIAPGEVDERSILDVQPDDLAGFTQCHFFAGIGGWSYALTLVGWPDDRPVWTGSCPCQPFSIAGKGAGKTDERHLWPDWFRLIRERKPSVIFGEQVASSDGFAWLAGVHLEMEAEGYAFGAANLCAAGVGAPHRRERHFFVADADRFRFRSARPRETTGASGALQSDDGEREWFWPDPRPASVSLASLDDIDSGQSFWWSGPLQVGRNAIQGEVERGGRRHSAQWRIKPGLSIVAHGIPGRVDQCRAFGNAIVPQVAAEFICAYLECERLAP